MNGRVYDPDLGRFISADPMVQAPGNGQSLNRYSYVWNNPLAYTDPSGYRICPWCSKVVEKFGDAIGVDKEHFVKYAAPVLAIAVAPYAYAYAGIMTGSYGAAWTAAGGAAGFTYGGVSTGTLEGAVYGGMTGASIGATIYGGYNLAMRGFNLLEIASQPMGSFGGGPDIAAKMLAQDAGHHLLNYGWRKVAGNIAERAGMSLDEFNMGLTALSFAGDFVTRFPSTGRFKTSGWAQTKYGVRGFLNRGWRGLPFDVVDTVLGYQGLPSATGWKYIFSSYTGTALTGHSLGTLDVMNLAGLGISAGGYAYSIPFGNAAPSGINVTLSSGDAVNLFGLGKVFNPDATMINGPLLGHGCDTVYSGCGNE
jgi:hypothetical protein